MCVWRNTQTYFLFLLYKLLLTCGVGIEADFFVSKLYSTVIFNRVYVQVQTDIHLDTKQQTLQGVVFPMQRDAIEALEQFRNKRINYVQLVSETYILIKEIYHYRVQYRLSPEIGMW